MKIGILGTGVVGATLGSKLADIGHAVLMGSRSADNPKAAEWAASAGEAASAGSFADAAEFGEIVFNCTAGTASVEAVRMAGPDNLAGKILIDVANPLDFSKGFPPSLSVCNTDSLGEQIQRACPDANVVKTLNTVNTHVMVDPGLVPGEHTIFVSGNDAGAKSDVAARLTEWFGWDPGQIIDLGDISAARATEMYLPLWIRLFAKYGHGNVSIEVRIGEK